jgi:hypothetical protein
MNFLKQWDNTSIILDVLNLLKHVQALDGELLLSFLGMAIGPVSMDTHGFRTRWTWIQVGNSPVDPIGSGTRNTSGRVRIVYFTHGYPLDTRKINSQFYMLCFWAMKQRKKAHPPAPCAQPAARHSAAATRHPKSLIPTSRFPAASARPAPAAARQQRWRTAC